MKKSDIAFGVYVFNLLVAAACIILSIGCTTTDYVKAFAAFPADAKKAAIAPYLPPAGIPEFFAGGVGLDAAGRFIHVDVRGTRARWGYLGGKIVPIGVAFAALQKANVA